MARSFNSLQTGKCIQRLTTSVKLPLKRLVSIPFKRESVFRASIEALGGIGLSGFNSLQTGKCIQRIESEIDYDLGNEVSIPFKRESVFRDWGIWACAPFTEEFQFPSNGKVYSELKIPTARGKRLSFNSLQTGKCIQRHRIFGAVVVSIVSIPFKRESVFRDEIENVSNR